MASKSVAISAPGKVLLVGGYIVLDRKYTGLVFGLDARIHVHVKPVATSSGVAFSEITVRSPQFRDAVWEYGYRVARNGGGVQVTELRPDADMSLKRNVYVETALAYSLSYISSLLSGPIEPTSITILADNDYYSTSSDELTAARFHNFNVPIAEANKTGLGSSAALITSFVAATLSFYLSRDLFDLSTDKGKRCLHNLAQAAHCAAQGKVGSGFDIASAVYGSCLYKRFSPELLLNCGEPGKYNFADRLRDLIQEIGDGNKWDTEVLQDAVKVPKGLRLVMCDVSCGSQTPAMVKKVLAWRASGGDEAEGLLQDIHERNQALLRELTRLAEAIDVKPVDYSGLAACIRQVREKVRELGVRSDVPIEPPAQTQLLNACTELDGIVGGVTPGSGGYDAVALLVEDRQEVLDNLTALLDGHQFAYRAQPDTVPKVRVMRVKQGAEGVRQESASEFDHWT